MKRLAPLLTALFLAQALSACGESPISPDSIRNPQTGCSANVAVIEVGDGFLRLRCGCQEAVLTRSTPGVALRCTVASGTTVFFNFQGAQLEHQILSSGAQTFPSSGAWSPGSAYQAHPAVFTQSGTYSYRDSFNASMMGEIVVP